MRSGKFALLPMLQVSDSLFPIGAFTLSNGLETLVQQNRLQSAEQLREYMNTYVGLLPYNELGAMKVAYDCVLDCEALWQLDEIYAASRGAMEVRVGSEKLCKRFLKVWEQIEKMPSMVAYYDRIKQKKCYGHHPIVVGLFAAEQGVKLEEAAMVYGYSLLSSAVTTATKTVPLSQMDGQKILNESMEGLVLAVEKVKQITIEDIGVGGSELEIAAMNHEILYSRLYMS